MCLSELQEQKAEKFVGEMEWGRSACKTRAGK